LVVYSLNELEGFSMARPPKPWYRKERKSWFVMLNGVQHNLGPDKKEAQRRFHEMMRQPQAKRVSPQSLAAIIDEFLDWMLHNRASSNYEAHRHRLQKFIEAWPNLAIDDLRPFHVEKWVKTFNVSRTTRRNYMRAVKRMVRWAKEQGYIDDNPVTNLKIPAGDRREVMIRPEEFDRLLSFVPDQPFRDLLIATWESGARPQEILKVTANHVDLANGRWVFPRSQEKMKRIARVVYLGEKALAITTRLMVQYPDGPLFRNSEGRPWTTSAVNCAFRRVRVRMGMEKFEPSEPVDEAELQRFMATLKPTRTVKGKKIMKSEKVLRSEALRKLRYRSACELGPKYCLYNLRHAFATNGLERGLDALTVAVLLGHSDPSTLARTYQHLGTNPKRLREQVMIATEPSD
jgi:integrase